MVTQTVTLGSNDQPDGLQKGERPGSKIDPALLRMLLDRVRWDDLQTFYGVSQQPSIRKASRAIGISPNTVRSRINRLEQALGTLLFVRDGDGLHITPEGEDVLTVARDMRLHTSGLNFGKGNHALVRDGEIRLCVSEGLGTFWLTPRLYELRTLLPELVVSMDSMSDQTRIQPGAHDVSVGFVRPTDPDAIVARLGYVHMMPFASEAYLRSRGNPKSLDDIFGHECVQQDAGGMSYDVLRLFLGSEAMTRLVRFKVSSSYSLFWAVASGLGIGAMPTYIRTISRKVIPVDLPVQLKFEIWVSYNRAARDSQPVRRTISWLRSCFDPHLYPWFGEEFLHPASFAANQMDTHVIPLFDHLVDDSA